jgi:hypothetical protein
MTSKSNDSALLDNARNYGFFLGPIILRYSSCLVMNILGDLYEMFKNYNITNIFTICLNSLLVH